MQVLIDCRDACRKASGLPLNLAFGRQQRQPAFAGKWKAAERNQPFSHRRSHLLGRNVLDRSPWQGTRQDGLRVVAEVIELETKPSIPIGDRGQDAFGNTVDFVDRGIRKRALLNLGRQDVVVDGLEPEDGGIIVLGGSSDHLVLDVSDAQSDLKVGDEIAFYPTYGALLAASTSPYVEKVVVNGL